MSKLTLTLEEETGAKTTVVREIPYEDEGFQLDEAGKANLLFKIGELVDMLLINQDSQVSQAFVADLDEDQDEELEDDEEFDEDSEDEDSEDEDSE